MARIITNPHNGSPTCNGCGEEMYWIPASLDSRCRGLAFSKEAAALGTLGYKVKDFADKHVNCIDKPSDTSVVPGTSIECIDRRRFKNG